MSQRNYSSYSSGSKVKVEFLIMHFLFSLHIHNSYMSIHRKTRFIYVSAHACRNIKLLFVPIASTLLVAWNSKWLDVGTYLVITTFCLDHIQEASNDGFHE